MRWMYTALVASVLIPGGATAADGRVLPLSDPDNKGGWVYNSEVSDEFNGATVNEERWFIVGKFEDGKPIYKHPDFPQKKVWKGRAPSQFSGRNYRLEDGKLKLEVRWEPDFPFEKEVEKPVFGEALPYANITTACLISRKPFKYGYIEIRSKAADAEISSAFWATGDKIEIDFFEMFGDGHNKGKEHLDQELWWSIRDWGKLNGKPSYTERRNMGFRGASGFHVYGIDWDEKGIRYYIDGKLFASVTREQVNEWARSNLSVGKDYEAYVATSPINLWLDNEVFSWNGMPRSLEELERNSPEEKKRDGVVDFEIDYVRVWQKS